MAGLAEAEGVRWYLSDHLGTVRDLADAAGEVIDHIAYDAFGNVLAESNPAAGDRFRFTGREFDAATGQYYYRARYYNAAIGRFTSEDPLGLSAGDKNLYRYVLNRPTVNIDPTGFRPPETPDEQKLIDLCGGDPALIQKMEALLDILDEVWVFPLWIDRCHAWADAFHTAYGRLPMSQRIFMQYEVPIYIGWWPFWKDHGVITFTLNGTKVYVDKWFQGGGDHISFEPHPHLLYPGTREYDEYMAVQRAEYEKRRGIFEEAVRRHYEEISHRPKW